MHSSRQPSTFVLRHFILRALLIGVSVPLALTACGGGGGSGSEEGVVARVKRLGGKVYAKLIGDKIGQLKAEVNLLKSEISGTLELDGNTFEILGMVDPENNFSVTFSKTDGTGDGATVLASGRLTGRLAEPNPATPDILSVAPGAKWQADLPTPGGRPGATTFYTGTVDPTATESGSTTTVGGTLPPAGSCEWSATDFYNPQQVVSYQGNFYTARQAVVPLGSVASALFNPSVNSTSWAPGGSACGPTPFVQVDTAECKAGANADVITITGRAYGGGIGDAIIAYTNVTDTPYSNENSFGLVGKNYSMTCTDGGFTGRFASATSPSYSVCVKTAASGNATTWTSTHTVPHSTTMDKFTTAYASKGNPLRATVFNVGAIVLGFDAVRSEGKPITGDCPR